MECVFHTRAELRLRADQGSTCPYRASFAHSINSIHSLKRVCKDIHQCNNSPHSRTRTTSYRGAKNPVQSHSDNHIYCATMASAAAVATNASRSPLPDHEVDDVYGTTGTITGADTNLPDEAPPAVEDGDDDDEDIARPTRRKPAAADLNGVRDDEDEELADENRDAEDELFGSDPEDPLSSPYVAV